MILVTDSLTEGIRLDIAQAWLDLQAAEEAQRRRDDPTTRARLEACRTRIDAILDMWLEAGGPGQGV
jgi:hypothetical protein